MPEYTKKALNMIHEDKSLRNNTFVVTESKELFSQTLAFTKMCLGPIRKQFASKKKKQRNIIKLHTFLLQAQGPLLLQYHSSCCSPSSGSFFIFFFLSLPCAPRGVFHINLTYITSLITAGFFLREIKFTTKKTEKHLFCSSNFDWKNFDRFSKVLPYIRLFQQCNFNINQNFVFSE